MKLKKIIIESFSKFIKDKNELELMTNYINGYYLQEGRSYHNNKHIEDMYSKASTIKSTFDYYEDVILSIIFHDIIYDEKGNNEIRSTEKCSDFLSKYNFTPFRINKINKMILATTKHNLTSDKDTNLLIDLDLSILGSDVNTFNNYCDNIYKEYLYMYSKLPDFNLENFNSKYLKNRIKILNSFNRKSQIFGTKQFRYLEDRAKLNISNEITKLEKQIK